VVIFLNRYVVTVHCTVHQSLIESRIVLFAGTTDLFLKRLDWLWNSSRADTRGHGVPFSEGTWRWSNRG